MMKFTPALLLALYAVAMPGEKDFPALMAEPNLERRSELALSEADKAVTGAKSAYEGQKQSEFIEKLTEVGDLVSLSYKSLEDTGKRARRSPKFFKRAELKVRLLLRRLNSLASDVSIEDKAAVESARTAVAQVHDKLINDLMTNK